MLQSPALHASHGSATAFLLAFDWIGRQRVVRTLPWLAEGVQARSEVCSDLDGVLEALDTVDFGGRCHSGIVLSLPRAFWPTR